MQKAFLRSGQLSIRRRVSTGSSSLTMSTGIIVQVQSSSPSVSLDGVSLSEKSRAGSWTEPATQSIMMIHDYYSCLAADDDSRRLPFLSSSSTSDMFNGQCATLLTARQAPGYPNGRLATSTTRYDDPQNRHSTKQPTQWPSRNLT